MKMRKILLFLPVWASMVFVSLAMAQEFRSADGSGNNLTNPTWGQAGGVLVRDAAANYLNDGQSPVSGPNPRALSNALAAQGGPLPDARGLSDYVWVWGQFIDHDLDHTPFQAAGTDTFNIVIPGDDTVFLPGAEIPFDRSKFVLVDGVRQQPNMLSPYLDAGVVYGGWAGDGDVNTRINWLRMNDGSGRLRVTSHGSGDMLPKAAAGDVSAPFMGGGPGQFIAGDIRANEHAALTTMHTLFMREHNRIADIIAARGDTVANAANAGMTTEDYIYQRARKIVGAEIQAITYNEFLPTMGISLSNYNGYDDTVNPSVSTEFATASFRLGHSQVSSTVRRLNEDGSTIAGGDLNLFEGFFQHQVLLDNGGIEPVLRGIGTTVQERIDMKMIDDMRNLLFGPPSGGPVANGSDLAALNIQRGRDHGLSSYNTTREAFGLSAVTGFDQITSDTAAQTALENMYGHVDAVELWVGILLEDHVVGSSVGETLNVMLGRQFERVRDGDRFFYQNDADIATWQTLSAEMTDLEWLNQLTLSEIILLNTDIEWMQENVFLAAARGVPEPSALGVLLLMMGGTMLRRRRRA